MNTTTNGTNPTGPGRLFVISGPSGSGKSTLCREALKRTDARLSISVTTRPPGSHETDGKDYYFLSPQEFKEKITANQFLEHAQVFGHFYGTPAEAVLKMLQDGQTVVLEIDVQGAAQVFERYPQARGILIMPPGQESLEERLRQRGRDDDETIKRRLKKAKWEIKQAQAGGHYQHTIVNDELDQAIESMVTLIG